MKAEVGIGEREKWMRIQVGHREVGGEKCGFAG